MYKNIISITEYTSNLRRMQNEGDDGEDDDGSGTLEDLSGLEIFGFFVIIFVVGMVGFCSIYLCLGDGRIKDKLQTLIEAPVNLARRVTAGMSTMLPNSVRMSTRARDDERHIDHYTSPGSGTSNPHFQSSKNLSKAIKRNQRLSVDGNDKE